MDCNHKRFKSILFNLIFLICSDAFSQSAGILKGVVKDADRKQALVGASVLSKENKFNISVTDANGSYELKLPAGNNVIVCSFLGMVADTFKLSIEADKITLHNLFLKPTDRQMDVVVISAGKY